MGRSRSARVDLAGNSIFRETSGVVSRRTGLTMVSAAIRQNSKERYADRLHATGVFPDYEGIGARVKSEVRTCPRCGQAVHPDNWGRHQDIYHADHPAALHEADPWLPLTVIRLDAGTQPRSGMNAEAIHDYAEIYAEPLDHRPLPPVDVFFTGTEYILVDGFHRITAAREAGLYDIRATVHLGSARDAVLFSLGVNAEHGLRRTADDKRRAVDRMLNDVEWGLWADRRIARQCSVSPTFVGQRRKLLTVHTDSTKRIYERDGNELVMQTGNIGSPSVTPRPTLDQMQDAGKLTAAAALALGRALDALKNEGQARQVELLMVAHGPVSHKLVQRLAGVVSRPASFMYEEVMHGYLGGVALSEASTGDWDRAAQEARYEHIAASEEAAREKKLAAGEPVFTPVSLTLYPGDPDKTLRALKRYMQSDGLNWYDWLAHTICEDKKG
ncbi:MAG: ParB-like nuclease domain-containing protein [Anaerolineae bacterium]|nr:ParB-like nuclease domain-containing protein [Anaerolineae bacterium]